MNYSKQILILVSVALAGCNSSEDSDANLQTDVDAASSQPEISITDEQGHGPDADSDEGARSAAWQLIKQSESFVQDGHDLRILSTERLPGDAPVWVVDYTWKHHGDPDGDYPGLVRVDNGVPEFVNMYGLYTPSCDMYEGETVDLQHGAYVWDRFTDTRSIDDEGNLVDSFPEHPMSGGYTRQAAKVSLQLTSDDAVRDYILLPVSGSAYLLTQKEYESFLASGEVVSCALQRRNNPQE